jgi:hypothetical protein
MEETLRTYEVSTESPKERKRSKRNVRLNSPTNIEGKKSNKKIHDKLVATVRSR